MKIVAVSQRVDVWAERGEVRDALDQRLPLFLAECGGLAVPVPNLLDHRGELQQWLDVVKPVAVVLSGGNDVGTRPDRDRTEAELLEFAKNARLPLLGICRGMQMIGLWAGVALKPVPGHVRTRHVLSGAIAGDANSYHNQSLSDCPGGFSVLARSEDGEIEAIGHGSLSWEGWMWHPEREHQFASRDIQRVRKLLF